MEPAPDIVHAMGDPLRRLALLGVLQLLAGCAASPPYPDERPDYVTDAHLAGIIVVGGLDRGIGSVVAIGPDRFVTALHVVDPLRVDGPRLRFLLRGRPASGTVLAQGETLDEDWAIVRVDSPAWSPEDVVTLAESAAVPGEELWVAGYATNMFPAEGVDPRQPARMVRTRALPPDREDPDEIVGEGRGLQLSGMSGGGLLRWNGAKERLELLGVFSGQSTEQHFLEGPFGLRLPTRTAHRMRFRSLPDAARDP